MNIGGWKIWRQCYNKTFFWGKATLTLLLGVFDIAKELSENSAFLKKCHLETNVLWKNSIRKLIPSEWNIMWEIISIKECSLKYNVLRKKYLRTNVLWKIIRKIVSFDRHVFQKRLSSMYFETQCPWKSCFKDNVLWKEFYFER